MSKPVTEDRIVVICRDIITAEKLAAMTMRGEIPAIYPSVEAARRFALDHYPAPQRRKYIIFEFDLVPGDVHGRASYPIIPA